jgi:hypothetical protein
MSPLAKEKNRLYLVHPNPNPKIHLPTSSGFLSLMQRIPQQFKSAFNFAHVSAKHTLELKVKSITEKLPLPAGGVFLRSAEGDILPGQHEDLSLLGDLVRIEGLLQQWTAGYIDTGVEIDVGGSWIEGIYITSIQRKMEVIGKCWKASLEDLDMPRIQAVDGVPRSQEELRVLLRSIKG